MILTIIDNLFDATHRVSFIKIYLHNAFGVLYVNVDSIFWRSCDHDILLGIHQKELWLSFQGIFESIDRFNFFSFNVQLKDLYGLYEKDRVYLLLRWVIFEIELHTGLWEFRLIFNYDSLYQLKFDFGSFFLEDEQLIDFLLLLDQILTRHDRNIVLANRHTHRNDLIWLPGLSFKQSDWNLTLFFESHIAEHVNLVNFRHKHSVPFVHV